MSIAGLQYTIGTVHCSWIKIRLLSFQGITSQRDDGWTVSRVHTNFTATVVNGPSRASFSPRFILRFTNPTPGVATTSTPCQESGFAWCSPTSSYTTTMPGNYTMQKVTTLLAVFFQCSRVGAGLVSCVATGHRWIHVMLVHLPLVVVISVSFHWGHCH